MVIALHGYEGDTTQWLPVTRALTAAGRVLIPEAPKPAVLYGRYSRGRSWYAMQGLGQPEPTNFGDALVALEQFLLETVEEATAESEAAPPIVLLGLDQGALLALSLACVWPELVSGVAAVGGYLPDIPGWEREDRPLGGMSVLLVHDPDSASVPAALQQKTEAELRARGAHVAVHRLAGARQLPPALTELVNAWMETTVPVTVSRP